MAKKRINAIRENLDGKSIYSLAKETGISYSLLHGYVNGKSEPGLDNLSKIAKALGVKVKDLIND